MSKEDVVLLYSVMSKVEDGWASLWRLQSHCRIAGRVKFTCTSCEWRGYSNFWCTGHFKKFGAQFIIARTQHSLPHPSMPRLSGLQKDVLALYRQCLRAARAKPGHTRPNFESFARREFEKNIEMDKKDFAAIEFLLRKGNRQLETYEATNITNVVG